MNRKSYSILFSCLLATTFFHELNAKYAGPPPAVRSALTRQKRDTSVNPLTLSCPSNNLLVIKNETASVAIVIDIKANITVLLNGTSGSGVCYKQNQTRGTNIPSGLWSDSDGTLEDFLQSINADLGGLLNFPGSKKFDLRAVPKGVLGEVTSIVILLVSTLDLELLANPTLALELVISLVGSLLDLLNGPLKGLPDLIGEQDIELPVDIFGLLNILQALGNVIVLVAGSLPKAVANGVKLPLDTIIGADDGLVALTNLIPNLPASNLTALAKLVGNPQGFFLLIAQLGGNTSGGLNGLFLVVGKLLALNSGSIQIEEFINILIQFAAAASQNTTTNAREQLETELKSVLEALKKVDTKGVLGGLKTTVEAVLNKTLNVDGVNVSGTIDNLLDGLTGNSTGLVLIVEVLLSTNVAALNNSTSVPFLLLILIATLNSPVGVQNVMDLGVDLGRGGCICKLLSGILSGIGNLLGLLFTGNLYGVLAGLPVIGNIVKQLNAAVVAASGGTLSLKTLLNLSELVKTLIKGVLQLVTGITTGLQSAVAKQAKNVMNSCTQPSSIVHVNIIVYVSVSSG